MEKLESLQYNFLLLENVVEAAFHNPNLIVHMVGGIMSIPRIDYTKGEYWMYKEVFSPTVWNLVTALDNEKVSLLRAMNLHPLSYLNACKIRNSDNIDGESSKDIFEEFAKNGSIKGPIVSNSRYITEDVPEGLILLESFGILFNVATPVCSSLITIASACLKTDFRQNGRTVKKLGKNNIELLLANSKS